MKRETFLVILVIFLILLNATVLVIGFFRPPHPPGPGPRDNQPGTVEIFTKRLDLDKDQQVQFQKMVNEHRTEMDKIQKEMDNLHETYYAQLINDVQDSLEADSLLYLIGENRMQFERITFDHFKKIRGLCKPEQMGNYRSLIDEMSKRIGPPVPPPPPPH